MTLTVRNTIALGFAAALLVLLGNAAVADRNIADLAETERRVARAHEVQDALEKFLSTVKDAETGQRGYFITGLEAYLAPYEDAVAEVRRRLARVRELTADNPAHAGRLAALERWTREKLAELARSVEAMRAGDRDAAREVVLTGRGKRFMDDIREA